jgi:hypothetical protein
MKRLVIDRKPPSQIDLARFISNQLGRWWA